MGVSTSLWDISTVNSSGSSSAQICTKWSGSVKSDQAFPLKEEQPTRGEEMGHFTCECSMFLIGCVVP